MTPRLERSTIPRCGECGWTRAATTPGQAEYALRRHSCDKQRRLDAAHQRGLERAALVVRTERPCLHKVANHQHGTYACYVLDYCRCLPCSVANSEYEKARLRRNAYGRGALIDAAPARAHVEALQAAGMGWKRIAGKAGLGRNVVQRLIYGDNHRGPSVQVRRATAAALLAVTPDLAPGALVSTLGTRRRLQALACLGWSAAQIAPRAGVDRQVLDHAHTRDWTQSRTALAVAAFYERNWNTPPVPASSFELGGVNRTRRTATARGYAPALAWDDIDDPAEQPQHNAQNEAGIDEAAIERRMGGDRTVTLTRAERWVLIRRLHGQGLNDSEIERRTGVGDRQILRDRQALGLKANWTAA